MREQGATVERSVVVTGGWQTSAETAYVEATRGGVEWHVGRDNLDGHDDASRLDHLAERMNVSRAQEPSLSIELHDPSRLPDDPHNAFHVERLQPLAPADLTPERERDQAVER